MNNKLNSLSIMFIVLLLAALAGGVMLVGQNQNQQRGAYFSGASLSVQPAEISQQVGDTFVAQLWVQTQNSSKVNSVDTTLCYGDKLALDATDPMTLVELNQDAFKVIEYIKDDKASHCLRMLAVSTGISNDNLKFGLVRVANIKFKAAAAGTGRIDINAGDSIVGGFNPAGGSDAAMSISQVSGAAYTVTAASGTSTTSGTAPFLKFKMAFLGVRPDAQCADGNKMPLTVTVRAADGTNKAYPGVIPVKESGTSGEVAIYDVNLKLDGFNYANNLAVFIKGPKHLQVKYGKDGQTEYYGVAGGEISGLTTDETTTPTFNFSGYPLLAGDVTGQNNGQDGVVDGLDFSYVKGESIKRTEEPAGGYMLADLNGNCKMESQDLSELMLSLSVKQGQLY